MTPPAAAEALPRPRTTTRPRTNTTTRPRTAPRRAPVRHPRRISGPVRTARPARPAQPRVAAPPRGLALRVLHLHRRIADSALLDRLARGRLWIGVLAFSLIGIVAMQLIVLRLNAGIGATLVREASVQRENAQLGIAAATAAGEGRVEPLAAALGMTFAAPGSVHFVSAGQTYVARAAAALAQPIQARESAPTSAAETSGASESTPTSTGEASGGSESATGAASEESAPTQTSQEETQAGHG
ncbi:MAG TPA: hypothetical protein VHU13_05525 [Solirubrobacteraceae bacterium]|jgi:hypothetical protein|nr:hypothetical protein [Solirubrobacteraceae bacterium]